MIDDKEGYLRNFYLRFARRIVICTMSTQRYYGSNRRLSIFVPNDANSHNVVLFGEGGTLSLSFLLLKSKGLSNTFDEQEK